jgi:hypothetical protein
LVTDLQDLKKRLTVLAKTSSNLTDQMMETAKILSRDSQTPDRDLNPGDPKYEPGLLLTRPQSSVSFGVADELIASFIYFSSV